MKQAIYSLLPIITFVLTAPFIALIGNVGSSDSNKSDFGDLSKQEKIEIFNEIIDTGKCEYKGIRLYGKVEFVDHFADIKIKYVDHFPDIKVKMVDHFPDDCGKWKEVDHFPDFKVQVVEHFPDIKVQLVDHFPGMN